MTIKNNVVLIWICLVIFYGALVMANLSTTSTGSIYIKLENGIYAPKQVSFVEGTTLNMKCSSDVISATISWTKQRTTSFETTDALLTIGSVRRNDAGVYTCTVASKQASYTRDITVDILFAPEVHDIQGPSIVMLKEPFTLTCKVDSNPSPTYWWTFEKQDGATIEKRGHVFELTVYDTTFDIAVYCWTELTMFPTVGEPVTRKAYRPKRVLIHEPAYVWEFPSIISVNAGDDVYIRCKADGQPEPHIYYTKQGDSSFAQSGPALIAYNVGTEFDGLYTCHAENKVTPTGQQERRTSHKLYCRVIVKDPNVPYNCSSYCPHGPPLVTCPTTKSTSPNGKDESSGFGTPCGKGCSAGILIAIVIGWLAVVLVFAIGLTLFIRKKRKDKSVTKTTSMVQLDTQAQSRSRLANSTQPGRIERPQHVSHKQHQQLNEGFSEDQGYSSPYVEIQGAAREGSNIDSEQNLYDSVKEEIQNIN